MTIDQLAEAAAKIADKYPGATVDAVTWKGEWTVELSSGTGGGRERWSLSTTEKIREYDMGHSRGEPKPTIP